MCVQLNLVWTFGLWGIMCMEICAHGSGIAMSERGGVGMSSLFVCHRVAITCQLSHQTDVVLFKKKNLLNIPLLLNLYEGCYAFQIHVCQRKVDVLIQVFEKYLACHFQTFHKEHQALKPICHSSIQFKHLMMQTSPQKPSHKTRLRKGAAIGMDNIMLHILA